MHQLWQHPNGIWYALHGPRQRSRTSLRTSDRQEAQIRLGQLVATADSVAPDAPTIGAILDEYQSGHGPEVRSPDAIKYAVVPLKRHLGALLPQHLLPATIKSYAAKRKVEGVGAGTILRETGVLRAALGRAEANKWIGARPSIPDPVRRPRSRERWLSRDEAKALLAACHAPHLRLFVMLGLMTAARTGAILELPWTQVNLDAGVIDYGEGHGNKRRVIVPVNAELATALAAAKTQACTPFVIEQYGKPLKAIKKGFASACARAKIEGVSPHILRHTAATWMIEDGVDEEQVARMLGDTVATVRRVYGHHSPTFLKRAAGALQLTPAA